jgi:hypothetical protein
MWVLLIIVLLVAGGLYWYTRKNKIVIDVTTEPIPTSTPAQEPTTPTEVK